MLVIKLPIRRGYSQQTIFDKTWTRNELAGLFALEAADGRKRLLRHGLTQQEFAVQSPLLAGRISVSTDTGLEVVADHLSELLTSKA